VLFIVVSALICFLTGRGEAERSKPQNPTRAAEKTSRYTYVYFRSAAIFIYIYIYIIYIHIIYIYMYIYIYIYIN